MSESMKSKRWLPYVVPFGVYMAFLLVQSNANLLWLYPVKTIAVAVALWFFRKEYEELRRNFSILAVVVGLVAIAIWIGIDSFYPKFSQAMPFDPTTIGSVAQRNVFLAFRVVGAVIVVPLMEELFWRAFLIRWLINENFKGVPVGAFTWLSFAVTAGLFGAEHTEWLAGLICGVLYNGLYYKRKDVFSCVVAHAVSNAALAAWVLSRGDWKFW
jgi:CAAX prenyl protease-like protein